MLSRTFDIDLFRGLLCDQKQNGRCWIYASLAPFRQKLGIQFSTNYIYYFDQMRKSKTFLQSIEESKDRPLNDPALSALLREPISTVGQWCYFASCVADHGLVPLDAMPDTAATENSVPLTRTLNTRLRLGARELRNGEADKTHILREIEEILREQLGAPPQHVWVQDRETTPQGFYQDSGIDLREYVTLIHHPGSRLPSPCACHVMSIDGWASDGRWRVQDSHGMDTGPDGHYVMTDAWFDAYVLSAVIRKEYLSPELLAMLDAPVYMSKEERF